MGSKDYGPTVRLKDLKPKPVVKVRELELAVLEGADTGRKFRLAGPLSRIGKAPDNDVVLDDPAVSAHHVVIEVQGDSYLLKDLGSTNGTLLNGNAVKEAFLSPDDTFQVGCTTIRFQPRQTSFQVTPSTQPKFGELLGQSLAMRELFGYLERVAPTDLAIVLNGETGTGKDVIARSLHQASPRKEGPLVVFDCGATEPSLIGAALFGHREGAFTGATGDRKGAFVSASGGTLFLDEIGELPLDLQPKLLRVLERQEVQPIGSDRPVKVDVRIVCATHRDLRQMVKEGRFREDLFYRLAGIVLQVPPLRKRPEDLFPLARHFLAQIDPNRSLGASVETLLKTHGWPGNVRELRNAIQRAAALAFGTTLEREHFLLTPGPEEAPAAGRESEAPRSLADAEKAAIIRALEATGWNRKEAALILGTTTKTLREKIVRYGLAGGADDDDRSE